MGKENGENVSYHIVSDPLGLDLALGKYVQTSIQLENNLIRSEGTPPLNHSDKRPEA
jgi:hypothetical protein